MDLSSKPAEAHTLEAFMDGPFLQWVSHCIRFDTWTEFGKNHEH